ncbi:MAG: UDP-glucose 6-dehydrogenase [Gemmatales bacterium]|nr:MAG: UDP-glucose 6-dehydrogenase [Gemmatales bacterium]
MRIAVIGTGYVGLVTGTCLAESGNQVVGVDKDKAKIDTLCAGGLPIYEPGLLELVQRNRRENRLRFTTSLAEGIADAQVIFLAVGTPQTADGSPDLSFLYDAADSIADNLRDHKIIVIKSTVPVGTNRQIAERMRARTRQSFDVVSNPEFLKEGAAVDDFMRPDRVVVGVRRQEPADILHVLYAPFLRTERPFLVMSPESAEMTKYAANAMLAAKISFINEIANLSELLGADINDVRRGIGHDERIGFRFLFPGVGYGGSCFPKDVRALIAMARQHGYELQLMEAVDRVNEAQKHVLFQKIRRHFRDQLAGKTFAIWGLAFKPRTDDIREAPSLSLITELLANGVQLRVHDPEAMANVRARFGDQLTYCNHPYEALEGADALAIVTEWQEFRNPDFEEIRRLLRQPTIFDGRNLYDPKLLASLGFTYYGIGRQVRPRD